MIAPTPRNFVQILELINPLGRWQIIIYLCIALMGVFSAMVNIGTVFFQYRPNHYCAIEALADSQFIGEEIRNLSLPLIDDTGARNSCYYYDFDYNHLKSMPYNQAKLFIDAKVQEANGKLPTIQCKQWVYDRSVMKNTVVTQWNLLCGREIYIAHARTCFMVGFFVGSLISGPIADVLGRKPGLIAFGLIMALSGIATAFQKSIYGYLALRFFQAVGNIGFYMCAFVYALEITTAKYRNWVGGLFFVPYAIGYTGLAGLAYAARDWKIMYLAIATPSLLIIPMAWIFPESPRWLLNAGKTEKARQVLHKAASWNNRTLPPDVNLEMVAAEIKKEEDLTKARSPFLEIRRYPTVLCRGVNIYFNWFVNTLVYYAITWGVASFSGDIFVNNAIAGAVELPAYLVCVPLLMWSRRYSLSLMLLLAGISLFASVPIPPDMGTARLAITMIGKFAITASFQLVYVYTVELFPTLLRSTGLSTSSMIGRLGSIAAAYIVLLPDRAVRGSREHDRLLDIPPSICGAFAVIGAVATLLLPETRAKVLPDTLDDAVRHRSKFEKYEKALTKLSSPTGLLQSCI